MNPVPPPPPRSPYRRERFDLVKIAFKEGLVNQANPNRRVQDATAVEIAKDVVQYVDAVLAEMEKEPEAENVND